MSARTTVKIEPEVLAILAGSTITETLLTLPPGQLERKLYEKVNKAIQLAGGKWNRSKQGFLFTSDPRAKLGLTLESGSIVDEKKLRQAFYTPPELAFEVAGLAEVAGYRVLEPSAGSGTLAAACLEWGARSVDCIEIEETCRPALTALNCQVTIDDFLSRKPYWRFRRIVMNPPFTRGQYHKHVAHARDWLMPNGRIYAIVPDNDCPKLGEMGASTVLKIPSGAFRQSGTDVATRLIKITRATS